MRREPKARGRRDDRLRNMKGLAKDDDAISFSPVRGDASASCAKSIRGLRGPAISAWCGRQRARRTAASTDGPREVRGHPWVVSQQAMGWAPPPSSGIDAPKWRCHNHLNDGSVHHGDCDDWSGSGEECVPGSLERCAWQGRASQATEARPGGGFFCELPRFMFPAAMAGPTRAMLEGGAPPKMLRALRGHLESLCLRYLQHEALRP